MNCPASRILSLVVVLFAPPLIAGTGDAIYLNGNDVLVRRGAGPEHAVIMTLDRGQRLTELERQGEWVRVRIEQPGEPEGWVHSFFTQSSRGTQPSERPQESPLDAFREDIEDFNGAARRLSGAPFFTGVEPISASAVELKASENWLSLRPAERDRMLDQLFRLWSGYSAGDEEAAVYVVNPRGQRVMQRPVR